MWIYFCFCVFYANFINNSFFMHLCKRFFPLELSIMRQTTQLPFLFFNNRRFLESLGMTFYLSSWAEQMRSRRIPAYEFLPTSPIWKKRCWGPRRIDCEILWGVGAKVAVEFAPQISATPSLLITRNFYLKAQRRWAPEQTAIAF